MIRPGAGRGTLPYGEPVRPAVKPRLPVPRPKGPSPPTSAPPSTAPAPAEPATATTDGGLKRKLDQVAAGIGLPSPKASKGAAKGAATPPEPKAGKGGAAKGAVLTPKAKSMPGAPAEDEAETPASPTPGLPKPQKFVPASKAKPAEPKAEPPNGKSGGKGVPPKKGAVPTQKGAGKAPEKGEKGKSEDGGKGKSGKSKGKDAPREPSMPPPSQTAPSGEKPVVVSGRLKTLEFQLKKVLQDWSGLAEDQKPQAMQIFIDRILEVAPMEQQRYAMEKLVAAGVNGEAPAEPEDKDNQETQESGPTGQDEEPSAEYKAMEDFITQCESSSPEEWSKAWQELQIPRQAEKEMLTCLFEVVVNKDLANKDFGFFDFLPRVVTQLVTARKIFLKNVELALKEITRRIEELAQANDQAWHLLSYMMLYFFPKGMGTDWGFSFMSWTWETWWKTTKEVLGAAQKYRAFDILVLLLQLMQEKSEQVLKSLPAWTEPSKTAKVREVLCQWGDMDEAAIRETLSAYGVEL